MRKVPSCSKRLSRAAGAELTVECTFMTAHCRAADYTPPAPIKAWEENDRDAAQLFVPVLLMQCACCAMQRDRGQPARVPRATLESRNTRS